MYLNELDQHVKHALRAKHYIRYTDDFVIVDPDPYRLHILKDDIELFLKNILFLDLHPDKVSIRKYSQGADFLGYVTLPRARVLRTKTKRRILRKLRDRVHEVKRGEIAPDKLSQSVASYMGVLSHANCHGLAQKIRTETDIADLV